MTFITLYLKISKCHCAGTLNTKDDSRGLVSLAVRLCPAQCAAFCACPGKPAALSLLAILLLLGLHGLGATLPARIGLLGGLPVGLMDTGVSWVSVMLLLLDIETTSCGSTPACLPWACAAVRSHTPSLQVYNLHP